MHAKPYSSADFGKVDSSPAVEVPERLKHPGVLDSGVAGDDGFSAERRHLVRTVDLPSRVVSMTIGGLLPGQSTRKHRHNYETIIYVQAGRGASTIEGREVAWEAGDAIYIPAWAWHQHRNLSNTDKAFYIACENAPLLQNLGVAVREEA